MSDMNLSNVDGQLCICFIDGPWDKPEYTHSHYPTGAQAREFTKVFGDLDQWEVHPDRGTYCICKKKGGYGTPSHTIHLKDGGKTKSIKFERSPVPRPKVKSGIELRWNGSHQRWEKLLKNGWKTIY